ncbi:hypothetical protein M0804_009691 [Polistes exclamans]|nr:hypothetical protein M0804_009691 [Polistes exclamans]
MVKYTLPYTVHIMRSYYQNRISAEETAATLFLNSYFENLEVCVAVINYWFRFFDKYPTHRLLKSEEFFVCMEVRLDFISSLLKNNPFWTMNHLMDALKLSRRILNAHIQRLEFVYGPQGWIQQPSMSQ